MKRIAIIGAGISGVSMARMLDGEAEVVVFEKKERIGGLIQCEWVDDRLFHKVGGHVFNSRDREVRDWFWSFFDQEKDFLKAKRNARIWLNDGFIGYPIENFIYQLNRETAQSIIADLIRATNQQQSSYNNFEDFLKGNFGNKLYELYFKPYNEKIWNTNLKNVPLEWLEGKLPMPELESILVQNILREEEENMVHSNFFYPLKGGSQFIIERLADGLDIRTGIDAGTITVNPDNTLTLNDREFDGVIYTGDSRRLKDLVPIDSDVLSLLTDLKSNGTSNMLCETDGTDTSWLYIPEPAYRPHRIIYTGNFSPNNNKKNGRTTCVVEFSGIVEEDTMRSEIKRLPGNLVPIQSNQEKNSYVIQNHDSRLLIENAKQLLEPLGIFLLGRFAEWEYYNMDKCMLAAMKLKERLLK